ncbi:hypothetical protein [Fructobacillus ficulneus]|uniref:Uncharacterized protein n=1 Tax=Fructobacillus ficulneus TaxID=157463 RepID=A0A0K8MI00_9LACO|nr:hypothetical protein [Fructobacillus ficulneus]GAO99818.1 hypothetical protein FFIC_240930 [Fructobacillus ficulneus]
MIFKQYDYVELNDGRKMVIVEPLADKDHYVGEVMDNDGNTLDLAIVAIRDVIRVIS